MRRRLSRMGTMFVVLAALLALAPLSGLAQRAQGNTGITQIEAFGTCYFDVDSSARMQIWSLQASCMTPESIVLPHGATLNGNGYIITAVSPESGPFLGAVITNEPVTESQPRVTVNVTNVKINAGNLAGSGSGDTRLRGVWLNGASGSVTNVTILALNRGQSGVQEGNAIEAVNYDESGPTTRVTIANNTILNWQKTGIVVNLNVNAQVVNNFVGVSSNEQYLAPNTVQIGYGASANVLNNNLHGSQWLGETNFASAGILVYEAGKVEANGNTLNYNPFEGNAEIGLYIINTDNSRFIRNILYDNGPDTAHPNEGGYIYDIGIHSDCDSTGNVFAANRTYGFSISTMICSPSPGRGLSANSMTTLSRGMPTQVADVPAAPQPFF